MMAMIEVFTVALAVTRTVLSPFTTSIGPSVAAVEVRHEYPACALGDSGLAQARSIARGRECGGVGCGLQGGAHRVGAGVVDRGADHADHGQEGETEQDRDVAALVAAKTLEHIHGRAPFVSGRAVQVSFLKSGGGQGEPHQP